MRGRRLVTVLSGLALLLLGTVAARRVFRRDPRSPSPDVAADVPVVTLRPVASGVGAITSIENAGDPRLFVTTQDGFVRILSNGTLLPAPFLDVSRLVSCCGERGLLSIAFHPNYAQNGFFFTYSTNPDGDIEIARAQRSAADANRADPGTRVVLLTIPHPVNANHNGGQLQFGPDGYLYFGPGDGGSANDPPCNAQRDEVLLGKLLRIDVDQNVDQPPFYGIPPTNPFASSSTVRHEIWAKGLRNPWRFSFDRLTGDLWIGDVGQNAREEIDFQPQSSHGGENYGWKLMEGTRCGDGGSSGCPPGVPPCNSPAFTAPTYEYDHSFGCAVIGGYRYRGVEAPALYGRYVYGDLCSGRLWADTDILPMTAPQLATFGEDAQGELYLGTQSGVIAQFVDPAIAVPPPGRTLVAPPRRVVTPRVLERQPQ